MDDNKIQLNQKLSENFSAYEFFNVKKSGSIRRHDIAKARMLCQLVLQPMRDMFGSVTITSGKRSTAFNKEIGGATYSDHLYQEGSVASDFTNKYLLKCFEFIKNFHINVVGQLIIYPDRNFIHVSLSTLKHTGECLISRAGKYEQYTKPSQLI